MSINECKIMNTCGCCQASVSPTPKLIWNRPGLTLIKYRVGRYCSFREAMIQSIALQEELRNWTARTSDDYGIALLEMWAYLADILTFYQERVANEAFLRTAILPESVRWLAALLDYKPSPGLAAAADLVFMLEKEKRVQVPVGLRVQSKPGQDEKPQKFETVEGLKADAELNKVRIFPQPQYYNPLEQGSDKGMIISDPGGLAQGDNLVVFDEARAELKKVSDLSIFDNNTIMSFEPPIQQSGFRPFTSRVVPYGRQFRLFGYNAPESYMKCVPDVSTGSEEVKWILQNSSEHYPFSLPDPFSLPGLFIENTFSLDSRYEDLKTGTSLLLIRAGCGEAPACTRIATIKHVTTMPENFGPIQDTVTQVSLDLGITASPNVILDQSGCLQAFTIGDDEALWTIKQVAPDGAWGAWGSLGGKIDMLAVGRNEDGRLEVFARGPDKALWHIWQLDPLNPNDGWSGWARLGRWIDMLAIGNNLDGRLEVFARGPDKALWHIWQLNPLNPNDGWSFPPENLHIKIDMLTVANNNSGHLRVFARRPEDKALLFVHYQTSHGTRLWGDDSLGLPMWAIQDRRQIQVFEVKKPSIHLWNHYFPDTISGDTVCARLNQIEGLEPGRTLILDDKEGKPQRVTITSLSPVYIDSSKKYDYLVISFTPELTRRLDTKTAVLYGNVAKATHGETIKDEILGNGDASKAFQSFTLKKNPVTFLPDAKARQGAANTLAVRVDGVLWHEKDTLYGQDETKRVFTTSIDEEGVMGVRFGDGKTGARVTTGRNNVVATYRQGLGRGGNVSPNALTTLLDRPVGLKSVFNPIEASGGVDPETLQEARKNAPNTVRTFGRIVSLQDFEDAAREFIGIAKARAIVSWNGEEQYVHLTVAGEKGDEVGPEVMDNLFLYLNERRDPNRYLCMNSYKRIPIRIEALIHKSPDYEPEPVVAAASEALLYYFAFDNLDLGQPIHISDIYRVLQEVAGVIGVDINRLQFKNEDDLLSHNGTGEPVQSHMRIFPSEMAVIEVSATDAILKIAEDQS